MPGPYSIGYTIQPAVGSAVSETARRRPLAERSPRNVVRTPSHRPWAWSHRIRGSESNRSTGTAKSAHVGMDSSVAPARLYILTRPFVVWTTWYGLTAIHGSGGSQVHASTSPMPANVVVMIGGGWLTTSGAEPIDVRVAPVARFVTVDEGGELAGRAPRSTRRRRVDTSARGEAAASRAARTGSTALPSPTLRPIGCAVARPRPAGDAAGDEAP